MYNPEEYQVKVTQQAKKIIQQYDCVYLAMEMRTRKTCTSFMVCQEMRYRNVIFITKLAAIPSVKGDHKRWFNDCLTLEVVSMASLHKVPSLKDYDCVIVDEAHNFGTYPIINKAAKQLKELLKKNNRPVIYLSGTPSPESFSQLYHQFALKPNNLFKEYKDFYKWAKKFVDIKTKELQHARVNDYSAARWEDIKPIVKPIFISVSQEKAGFRGEAIDIMANVSMPDDLKNIIKALKKNKLYKTPELTLVPNGAAGIRQKIHQIGSGTVVTNEGVGVVLSDYKARFIKDTFTEGRLAILYVYTAELDALKKVFGEEITDDIKAFKSGKTKHIAQQVISVKEGVNLTEADSLIYYNVADSATCYSQARQRTMSMMRTSAKVYFILSDAGLEKQIYKNSLIKNKEYTSLYYEQYVPTQDNKTPRKEGLQSSLFD
jgi:hypothetical protein